jgi:hypothetical protein
MLQALTETARPQVKNNPTSPLLHSVSRFESALSPNGGQNNMAEDFTLLGGTNLVASLTGSSAPLIVTKEVVGRGIDVFLFALEVECPDISACRPCCWFEFLSRLVGLPAKPRRHRLHGPLGAVLGGNL